MISVPRATCAPCASLAGAIAKPAPPSERHAHASADPAYLKTLHGPLPQVRLLPTGGVNLNTISDFLKAGACAVGLGGALVEPKAVQSGDMARIHSLAAQYVEIVKQTRAAMK